MASFFLDLGHRHGTDFGGLRYMGTTAGLQVVALDADQTNLAGSSGWFDAHGLHQFGLYHQFFVADPLGGNCMVFGDQAVELGGDLVFIETGFGNVEVEPPLAVSHLPLVSLATWNFASRK